MEAREDKDLLIEQYRIYSESKEKFIDRQFATNKFYLVFNVVILLLAYYTATMLPQFEPVLILCIIGLSNSIMWLLNIDSYELLIKAKYRYVLEEMEKELPAQPYQKEFEGYKDLKKNKHLIVFGDIQKFLAVVIIGVYCVTIIINGANYIKFQLL